MSKIYAEGTPVPVAQSRAEIETLVVKHGATRFGSGMEPGRALIVFDVRGTRVQMTIPLPDRQKFRTQDQFDRRTRERWRALLLTIKAKLVSIENGVETFEEAFLAHIVLPTGGTVGQHALPAVKAAYEGRPMPPLLGSGAPPP